MQPTEQSGGWTSRNGSKDRPRIAVDLKPVDGKLADLAAAYGPRMADAFMPLSRGCSFFHSEGTRAAGAAGL
jgi:hypothetical protein